MGTESDAETTPVGPGPANTTITTAPAPPPANSTTTSPAPAPPAGNGTESDAETTPVGPGPANTTITTAPAPPPSGNGTNPEGGGGGGDQPQCTIVNKICGCSCDATMESIHCVSTPEDLIKQEDIVNNELKETFSTPDKYCLLLK